MTFCAAPFVHMVHNPDGQYRTCCMFEKPLKGQYKNIQEAFDSEENQIIRKRMLSGETLPECKKCDYDEEHRGKVVVSYRGQFNERWPKPDGNIRSLEISTSNICNFKCITCDEHFSNQFGETIKNELPDPKVYEHLEHLKILGGEPFLDKRNYEIIEQAPREQCELQLVTNGSIYPPENIVKLLNEFKKTTINVSIDGIGEIAEFVRPGTKWERVERNFRKWEEHRDYPRFNVHPHFVLHALNAPYFEDFLSWVGMPCQSLSWDILVSPKHLNISYLPDHIKEYILDKNPTLRDTLETFMASNKYTVRHFHKLGMTAFNAPDIMDDYIEKFYEG